MQDAEIAGQRQEVETQVVFVGTPQTLSSEVKRIIESFLATDQEVLQPGLSVSAPQANAYDYVCSNSKLE